MLPRSKLIVRIIRQIHDFEIALKLIKRPHFLCVDSGNSSASFIFCQFRIMNVPISDMFLEGCIMKFGAVKFGMMAFTEFTLKHFILRGEYAAPVFEKAKVFIVEFTIFECL